MRGRNSRGTKMRLAEALRLEFLAGREVNPVEFASRTGFTRQAVTKTLNTFGKLVTFEQRYFGHVARKSLWRCVDLPGMQAFEPPALQRGATSKRDRYTLATAPTHWQPLLEAWGLPIRPLDVVECEPHLHEQAMTGDDDEL